MFGDLPNVESSKERKQTSGQQNAIDIANIRRKSFHKKSKIIEYSSRIGRRDYQIQQRPNLFKFTHFQNLIHVQNR